MVISTTITKIMVKERVEEAIIIIILEGADLPTEVKEIIRTQIQSQKLNVKCVVNLVI